MQDHKTIVLVVVRFNIVGDVLPVFRRHVGRVHQRVVFVDSKVRHLGAMELWHQRQLALQMPGDRDIAVVRALHPDGPAGIGDVNGFFWHGSSID